MLFVPFDAGLRKLSLDVCMQCKFVWFDAREYVVFAEQPTMTEEPGKLVDKKWKWIPAILGMPVERQTHPILVRPWLTWSCALVISLVSVAAFMNLQAAVSHLGLIPADLWRYGGLTLLTAFFLHAGWFHLISNVYFLVVFGDNVEDYLGRLRYLWLLLLATLAGDALHIALDPHSTMSVIGASGGISGLVAFYGLQFPEARIAVLLTRFFWWPLRMRARTALLLWFLLQFLLAWLQAAGRSNISALAHLGGAAVGLVFWLVWRSR